MISSVTGNWLLVAASILVGWLVLPRLLAMLQRRKSGE